MLSSFYSLIPAFRNDDILGALPHGVEPVTLDIRLLSDAV